MKFLVILPLVFGIRFFYRWVIVEGPNLSSMPEHYRRAFPIRVCISIGLIALSIFSLFQL